MKASAIRLSGIRCFSDTGIIELSPRCNIFVGQNNAGKSTLLKGFMDIQGMSLGNADVRYDATNAFVELLLSQIPTSYEFATGQTPATALDVVHVLKGAAPGNVPNGFLRMNVNSAFIKASRPQNAFVPFLAKRKAMIFDEGVSSAQQLGVTGTFANLYARVDLLSGWAHPKHKVFRQAVDDIIGIPIGTTPSENGKKAGFYLDQNNFVTLDRMGDGITEMVGLITELCLEDDKIFILEEPETNLHPKGLKALLALIRASQNNQFIIATHSNIVVRDLAFDESAKIFRVHRDGTNPASPSSVEQVERSYQARESVLRDLGYEFADMDLHEAWLFFEESSAETIVAQILIPNFVPELAGRLRTFSAGGAGNVEPSVSEFQRLVTFVHLEPVYQDRLWVRTDGDSDGIGAVEALCKKFPYLTHDKRCATFSAPQFERFYPKEFEDRVENVLAVLDKKERRIAKQALLAEVIDWTKKVGRDAANSWADSAAEVIEFLKSIRSRIDS